MGYYTNCSAICRDCGYDDEEKILRSIKEEYFGGVDSDHVTFETQHYWVDKDYNFFKKLSKKFPGVIIEVDGSGEEDGDMWSCRFRDGEMEEVQARIEWPPFGKILSKDEQEEGKE